ncbi:hypothetical protein AiwAL_18620 [Acidiphilium sp. AL]|uniref:Lipoprotein n=1 Tax=Acidiphilium iwatense TaxID=768198 RepID=A0ABS9DTP3_9PROT|nr:MULTISPECIES: hypothetical protein [Acidiphilium]MCF3946082.1 hypothetical protein [Acidiphilium iwatense]MCU4162074.1 hypothetical protein [Acidiphilium sp. AL]
MNRYLALIPLGLLSACAAQHLGVTPASTVQLELPVAKPRLYTVTIGSPTPIGQQTPLMDMVVGALTAANAIDKENQAGSRPDRLTAMIGSEGDDFYVSYVLDVQSLLRANRQIVSIVDPSGQKLILSPAPHPAGTGEIAETQPADPPRALIVAPRSRPVQAAEWIVRLSHVEIGYNAPGIADYFKPTASADVALVSGPPGSKLRSIPISVSVPTGKYHFFTFQGILKHPKAARQGLGVATERLARETAVAIEARNPAH